MAFANRGKQTSRQKTIEVAGRKLRVVSRSRTWYANPAGFTVKITDLEFDETETYRLNYLKREDAETEALARFGKSE